MTASITITEGYLVARSPTTRQPRLRDPHWRAVSLDTGDDQAPGRTWLAYDARRHRPAHILGEAAPQLIWALEQVGARQIAHSPSQSTFLVPRSVDFRANKSRLHLLGLSRTARL